MSSSNCRNFSIVSLILTTVVGSARLAFALNDPALQFSPTSNPNPVAGGVWSYGYDNYTPPPGPFNLLTVSGSTAVGLDYWQSPSFGQVGVYYNRTAGTVSYNPSAADNAIYQGGELGMHPGPNDQFGVVQFTVPTNGFYDIHGTFEGLDIGGTTTIADLLENNIVVKTGNVIGFGSGSDVPLSFGPVLLNAGDTLAFAVGGNPVQGSTGLLPGAGVDAVAVPEPSSLMLLGLAFTSFAVYRLHRRFA